MQQPLFQDLWPVSCAEPQVHPMDFHETSVLTLNTNKSRALLGWKPLWNSRQAALMTALWYHDHYCGAIGGSSRSFVDIIALYGPVEV